MASVLGSREVEEGYDILVNKERYSHKLDLTSVMVLARELLGMRDVSSVEIVKVERKRN